LEAQQKVDKTMQKNQLKSARIGVIVACRTRSLRLQQKTIPLYPVSTAVQQDQVVAALREAVGA
jgi:hypothetical protein